jgi:hypothetical protein
VNAQHFLISLRHDAVFSRIFTPGFSAIRRFERNSAWSVRELALPLSWSTKPMSTVVDDIVL